MTSEIARLRETWLAHNVKINQGVKEEDLKRFQAQYGIILPEDFSEYFLCMNGMDINTTDTELIRFWSLEELRPLTDEAPEYAQSDYLKNAACVFPFADYSIWSHAYALRLSAEKSAQNEIYVIGCRQPILLAKSFAEFINLYLSRKVLDFLRVEV